MSGTATPNTNPAYEKVLAARDASKLTAVDYIKYMFGDSFIELHGDRRYSDDKAIVAGLAMLYDTPVTVIGIEKGRNTKERMERNFGQAHPEGYRKALRLMKQAEKFRRPVLCLVDTSGAMEMMTLKTPVLTILIGEGGSGGALALAVADEVWMLENSVYSVISPEGCASILWKDSTKAPQAAAALKMTAQDLFRFGVIERIIRQPRADDQAMFESLKLLVMRTFEKNLALSDEELTEMRYQRFRKIGNPDNYNQ